MPMKITEHRAVKLNWQEVCKIVSEEIKEILDIQVQCRVNVTEKELWAIMFDDFRLPLPKLCRLLQVTQASSEEWEDELSDEAATTVGDIGMGLTRKLIRRYLKVDWEFDIALEDCLWLIGVTDVSNTNRRTRKMKIGDLVYTPRFCTVRISTIFPSEAEAHIYGYCEPTYYEDEYTILGKVLDAYHMEFAAIPKGAAHE